MKKKALLIISISCVALALIGVTYKKKFSKEVINKKQEKAKSIVYAGMDD